MNYWTSKDYKLHCVLLPYNKRKNALNKTLMLNVFVLLNGSKYKRLGYEMVRNEIPTIQS